MSQRKQFKDVPTPSTTTTSSPSPSPSPSTGSTLLVDEEASKKWRSAGTRGWTSLLMMAGFTFLFSLGHLPLLGLLFFLQTVMFKEIKRLSKVLSSQTQLPSFRPLHWYWFFTAVFFTYGRVSELYFHLPIIKYHTFFSFCFYIMGVVMFVMSLETGYYKYQFEMFAWIHLTLLMVVVQSTFIVVNMFSGLIWFILPALLIISNDSWAYFFGFFFGRTPLIQISPKKTWEGFVGAFFATLATGFFLSRFLENYQLMICTKNDLTFEHPTCQPSSTYIPVPYQLTPTMQSVFSMCGYDWTYVTISPMQFHGVFLALFASLIAPFGGFFASGFKRAFHIKDFGESIPGHGGVTDRMDCQIMMGLFVYVYFQNFVRFGVDSESYTSQFDSTMHLFKTWPAELQLQFFDQISQVVRNNNLVNGTGL